MPCLCYLWICTNTTRNGVQEGMFSVVSVCHSICLSTGDGLMWPYTDLWKLVHFWTSLPSPYRYPLCPRPAYPPSKKKNMFNPDHLNLPIQGQAGKQAVDLPLKGLFVAVFLWDWKSVIALFLANSLEKKRNKLADTNKCWMKSTKILLNK